jgi:glycosyltransferase involved in cell wall biosynthesis
MKLFDHLKNKPMSLTPLYHIRNILLHESLETPALHTKEHGYYFIFWWHNFALGHLFVEIGQTLSDQEYIKLLSTTIQPTVEYYTSNTNAGCQREWNKWLITRNVNAWSECMERIFLPYKAAHIPASVPISVIICTYDRNKQLQKCLSELNNLNCLPGEVIVVDNAPEKSLTSKVVEAFENTVYVKEPRRGLDIARNTGISNAKFPIVAFIDDDVTVHPLWLYYVWQTLHSSEFDAMTGLVIASELETEAQCIFEKFWSFNRGYKERVYDENFISQMRHKGPPVWEIGAGANMAFKKEVFTKYGYFDELLDAGAAGCSGDSEIWYRLLVKGSKICYNPRAIVFHEHRKEIDSLNKQLYNYMRGHVAAALIQQEYQKAGYNRHLYKLFLKTYIKSIVKGFPAYRSKYRTLWSQIKGALAGLAYYHRNKAGSNNI